jgi:hypothetical protein
MTDFDWDPQEILRDSRETLASADEMSHFVDRQRERLENYTSQGKSVDLAVAIRIASSLEVYATYLAMKGAVAVCDGNPDGWKDIHGTYVCRSWSARVALVQAKRSTKRRKGSLLLRDSVAECLAHAIATGDVHFADWYGNEIVNDLNNGTRLFTHMDHRTPFEPMIIKLYSIWRQRNVRLDTDQGLDLGVYAPIFEFWEDNSQFTSAIQKACDYHCDDNGLLRYANIPYFIVPVEILAIQKVRRDLGFPDVTIHHPLMETAFTNLSAQTFEDELISRSIEVLRKTYPEIP